MAKKVENANILALVKHFRASVLDGASEVDAKGVKQFFTYLYQMRTVFAHDWVVRAYQAQRVRST